jgi:hypothetical protein
MNDKKIREDIGAVNEEALFIDGFDGDKDGFNEALIGFGSRCGMNDVAIYSVEKIIDILICKYDMDTEDASEWYEYNIEGAYMGENTPIFVYDLRNE